MCIETERDQANNFLVNEGTFYKNLKNLYKLENWPLKNSHGARTFTRPTIYQTDFLPDHDAIIQLR